MASVRLLRTVQAFHRCVLFRGAGVGVLGGGGDNKRPLKWQSLAGVARREQPGAPALHHPRTVRLPPPRVKVTPMFSV